MKGTGVKSVEEMLEEIWRMLTEQTLMTKRFLNVREAAIFLGISMSQLYQLTRLRKIEHYCPRGKQIYFTRESLEKHILQNRVPTQDETSQTALQSFIKRRNK